VESFPKNLERLAALMGAESICVSSTRESIFVVVHTFSETAGAFIILGRRAFIYPLPHAQLQLNTLLQLHLNVSLMFSCSHET
jgi:hypothetical protein